MKLRHVAHAAWIAGLALCGATACFQTMSLPRNMHGPGEPEPGQMDLRREYWDKGPAPRQLHTELEGLVRIGGAFEKHGRERSFFRSGATEYERHWTHGAPAGTWKSWWENGTLRSQCEFTRDGSITDMFFWHANGQLEGRGPGLNGRRIGLWEFFRADGSKDSAGHFLDGTREGEWTFWDECGEVIETGRFERGAKVGDWYQRP